MFHNLGWWKLDNQILLFETSYNLRRGNYEYNDVNWNDHMFFFKNVFSRDLSVKK